VWTALVSFCAAAVAGGIGVATDSPSAQRWSIALGRVAAFFWITYLPLSLLAMQTNWNGLFLTEPRWRLGVDFALASLLVQAGIAIMKRPRIASAINLGFALALLAALYRAEEVMHPSSPITSSEALRIQLFFYLLTSVCVYAAAQAARIARAAIRVR
jgi:hypothetical protein